MVQLHFGIKQLKICKTRVLHSFVWNYVKYFNMEGFHRDSHIYRKISNVSRYEFTSIAAYKLVGLHSLSAKRGFSVETTETLLDLLL